MADEQADAVSLQHKQQMLPSFLQQDIKCAPVSTRPLHWLAGQVW